MKINPEIHYETVGIVNHHSKVNLPDGASFATHTPYFDSDYHSARYTYPLGSPVSSVTIGRSIRPDTDNIDPTRPLRVAVYTISSQESQSSDFCLYSALKTILDHSIAPFAGVAHTAQPENQVILDSIRSTAYPDHSEIAFFSSRPDPRDDSYNENRLTLTSRYDSLALRLGSDIVTPPPAILSEVYTDIITSLKNIEQEILINLSTHAPNEEEVWEHRKSIAMRKLEISRSVADMHASLSWFVGHRGDITGQASNGFELWSSKDQWSFVINHDQLNSITIN